MKTRIVYVTSNLFKAEENRLFRDEDLGDGTLVMDIVDFEIRAIPIREPLEINLVDLVRAEATEAYRKVRVPCIVEHAGLIFKDLEAASYPGGLTKPMWNSLKERFIDETNSRGRLAIARAVVAYCDGIKVRTFTGDTEGRIAHSPRGSRHFDWDTVFVPTSPDTGDMTYAEIADNPAFGVAYKVAYLSQSTKAMRQFVKHIRDTPREHFWQRPAFG